MKPYLYSLKIFLKQIWEDSMLAAICGVPVLMALLFRFGVPELEMLLCQTLGTTTVLSEYYLLFDLFLVVMTPYLFTFISAMVMLGELDENMAVYLAVTPLGKKGYIISRLVLPAAISLVLSVVLLSFFALTPWTFGGVLLVSLLCALLCLPVAMLIVTLSHNRVEGMAVAKLSGLVLFGLPIPFFLPEGIQYLFSWLPSFWVAKVFVSANGWLAFPAVFVTLIWIWALYRHFARKMI
ncbi:MAG: ABC transporter permease [Eubacteriales bacterium]